MEDDELKKKLKKIPDVDKNGDPIYKIDDISEESNDDQTEVGEVSNTSGDSAFKETPQDLKDTTSQE